MVCPCASPVCCIAYVAWAVEVCACACGAWGAWKFDNPENFFIGGYSFSDSESSLSLGSVLYSVVRVLSLWLRRDGRFDVSTSNSSEGSEALSSF